MTPPPSRRTVLRACGLALGNAFAGCASQLNGGGQISGETTTAQTPTTTHPCAKNAALPYTIPGAEDTYQPSTVRMHNRSGREVTLTLTLTHEQTTFFKCTRTFNGGQKISIEEVTKSAGDYTVRTSIADAGSTESNWYIPPGNNYPQLFVSIPASGDPLVGCSESDKITLNVENTTDDAQRVALALHRDGQSMTKKSVTVEGNSTRKISLLIPIGDFYTLTATTDAGSKQTEIAECYAYSHDVTVLLDGGPPEIDSTKVVLE